ncbi:hypothetical protein ASF10_21330 [Flavobacterium sp. Leaf82]|nr:hypothetical protein ASF10_21330 [Flavobacterium sp. Leaf82]
MKFWVWVLPQSAQRFTQRFAKFLFFLVSQRREVPKVFELPPALAGDINRRIRKKALAKIVKFD